MEEVKPPLTYEQRIEEEGFYDRFIAHYIRLGTWEKTEAYMNVVRGSFEVYLADNKEFSNKLHNDLLSAGCQMAIQTLPSSVTSLKSIITAGNEDPKNTLQAISSLTQIISRLQIGDKSKGDEDDIDKLYKKYGPGKK